MSAMDARDAWRRACERYDRLAESNPFFAPLAAVVHALAAGACAHAVVARVDGVDLQLVRASAADESPPAAVVRLRALTDGAVEIRCVDPSPRDRPRIRIVAAEHAAVEVERCLWELGWVAEDAWGKWE